MKMDIYARRQKRKDFEHQIVHIASRFADVRGIDEQDVSWLKDGEQLARGGLYTVANQSRNAWYAIQQELPWKRLNTGKIDLTAKPSVIQFRYN